MSVFLPNTTTTGDYKGAVLGGDSTPYDRGQLLIANNPASVLVSRGKDRSSITEDEYPYVTPSLVPLVRGANEYIFGVKVKSAIAASPAQVSGYLVEPGVAGLGAGSAFTQQVAAGGGVTPGVSSVQIQKNNVLVGSEPIIDFLDPGAALGLTITDDPAGTRVLVTPNYPVKFLDFIPNVNQANLDTNVILPGNIPQIYSYIEFLLVAESAAAVANDNVRFQMNGDATANYGYEVNRVSNGVAASLDVFAAVSAYAGACNGQTFPGQTHFAKIVFPWYRSAKAKSYSCVGGVVTNAGPSSFSDTIAGNSTVVVAALTRINFFLGSGSNFVANSCRLIGYGYP